jgi:AraC-like DNA-binding protein
MSSDQDPLSEALEELRLQCAPLATIDRQRPWTRELPLDTVSIHVPFSGACHIAVDTTLWTHWLDRGEILIVNRGIGGALVARDEGETPEVVSARVSFDAPHGHPLLDGLPDLIQAGPGGGIVPASFEPLLEAFLTEMERPRRASKTIITLLLEALFIQGLRCHLVDLRWNDRGWFRVVGDPVLRSWPGPEASGGSGGGVRTVVELAASVNRSPHRASARFRELAGVTHSRLVRRTCARRAAWLLRQGETDLTRVAHLMGYRSRSSFCRAFRRELGVSPAAYWRSVHRRPFPRRPEQPAGDSAERRDPPEPE